MMYFKQKFKMKILQATSYFFSAKSDMVESIAFASKADWTSFSLLETGIDCLSPVCFFSFSNCLLPRVPSSDTLLKLMWDLLISDFGVMFWLLVSASLICLDTELLYPM